MVIARNLWADNASRYNVMNNSKLSKSLEKLSSGFKVNRAGDNAAGLAVSEKMRAQIAGIRQAVNNAQDGISMIQTYEGALTETHNILGRLKTLAAQSANGTYDDQVDRAAIELEYEQLIQELDDIATTDFNGTVIMSKGSIVSGGGLTTVQVPHNASATKSAGVNATIDASTIPDGHNETVNITEGKAATKATYSVAVSGSHKKVEAVKEKAVYNLTFIDSDGTNGQFTVLSGSKISFIPGKEYTFGSNQAFNKDSFITFFDTITDDLGLDADYNVSVTNTINVNNQVGFSVSIEADDFGADSTAWQSNAFSALSIQNSIYVDGGYVEPDSGSTVPSVKGVDKSDDSITLFNRVIALDDGDGGAKIAEKISLSGYTAVYSGGRITLTNDNTGDDINFSALSTLSLGDTAAGGTLSISGFSAVNGAGTVTPTITNTDWTKDTSDPLKYTKSGMTIQLGAVTSNGTLTLRGYYETTERKPVAAAVTNADSVSLQVGARTKDLKKFDFAYSQVYNTLADPDTAMKSALGTLVADINVTADKLGLATTATNLSTQANANAAIDKIDYAINKVSMIRATFGAIQNRLEHKIDNHNNTDENLTASESRIRDTDMATEIVNLSKMRILAQASQAMLAQANQLPQSILSLIQG